MIPFCHWCYWCRESNVIWRQKTSFEEWEKEAKEYPIPSVTFIKGAEKPHDVKNFKTYVMKEKNSLDDI